MGITHAFVNPKSDGGDATITRPSDWNAPHVFELDYVEITSNVSVTATTEGTANTVVTGSAVAYDGSTIVIITFFSPQVNPSGSATMTIILVDGSTVLGQLEVINTSAGIYKSSRLERRLTPSNASHTYSIRAYTSSGTATVFAGAGGTGGTNLPAFIRITRA